MKRFQNKSLLLLRLGMGWLFLYAGVSKIVDADWSAAGYLTHAQTWPNLFAWFATPENIGWVNFLNEWGLTLIGVALIFGVFVRLSSFFGILLMALYYLPALNWPIAGEHSYIVDDHIIYIFVLLVLMAFSAGGYCGLDTYIAKHKKLKKMRWLRWLTS